MFWRKTRKGKGAGIDWQKNGTVLRAHFWPQPAASNSQPHFQTLWPPQLCRGFILSKMGMMMKIVPISTGQEGVKVCSVYKIELMHRLRAARVTEIHALLSCHLGPLGGWIKPLWLSGAEVHSGSSEKVVFPSNAQEMKKNMGWGAQPGYMETAILLSTWEALTWAIWWQSWLNG